MNRIAYRTRSGLSYYYPTCARCGRRKGRSIARLCLSCGHWANAERSGLRVSCPGCGELLQRDAIIVALHYAGAPNRRIADVFGISPRRVGQIVRAWEQRLPVEGAA